MQITNWGLKIIDVKLQPRPIRAKMKIPTTKKCLKIIPLELQPCIPGSNESQGQYIIWLIRDNSQTWQWTAQDQDRTMLGKLGVLGVCQCWADNPHTIHTIALPHLPGTNELTTQTWQNITRDQNRSILWEAGGKAGKDWSVSVGLHFTHKINKWINK